MKLFVTYFSEKGFCTWGRVYEFHKPKTPEEKTMEILWDALDRKRLVSSVYELKQKGNCMRVGKCFYDSQD